MQRQNASMTHQSQQWHKEPQTTALPWLGAPCPCRASLDMHDALRWGLHPRNKGSPPPEPSIPGLLAFIEPIPPSITWGRSPVGAPNLQ